MASALKTFFLKLPQWKGNEYFKRIDFVDAFKTIDDAIANFEFICSQDGVTIKQPAPKDNPMVTTVMQDGIQLAKLTETKSKGPTGKDIWTNVLEIKNKKTKTWTDTQQSDGSWITEVKKDA